MPDINQRIVERLQSYPAKVAEVALKAVELAETQSERSVAEQIEALVRRVQRQESDGEHDS
jgi:hypothetical protein